MTVKKSPGFDFVVKHLEKDKDADYASVRAAAEKKGFTIYPIMYGRAKAKLGLVPVAPRGSRKKAEAARKAGGETAAVATASGPMGSLEAVIQAMKSGDAARERYRGALQRIVEIAEQALHE